MTFSIQFYRGDRIKQKAKFIFTPFMKISKKNLLYFLLRMDFLGQKNDILDEKFWIFSKILDFFLLTFD